MDMSGEQRIEASRETVWKALNNPNILRKCIPGCESMEKKSPTEMIAMIKVKVGPISSSFKSTVTLTNVNAPESYTMNGEGSGGLAGFVKGKTDVTLREEDGGTLLSYTINAQVGGKLAILGSKLIDTASKKLAKQFFEKLNKQIIAKAGATAGVTNPSEA